MGAFNPEEVSDLQNVALEVELGEIEDGMQVCEKRESVHDNPGRQVYTS